MHMCMKCATPELYHTEHLYLAIERFLCFTSELRAAMSKRTFERNVQ